MKTRLKMFGVGVIALVAFSTVFMLLWNVLIPDIFGLTTINFWQAGGLAIMSKMLFGGFPDRRSRGFDEQRERLFGNNPIHEKWMNMSPEEREEIIMKRREFSRRGPFRRDNIFNRNVKSDTNEDNKDAGQ